MAELSAKAKSLLGEALPGFASVTNPIDLTGALLSTPTLLGSVLPIIGEDAQSDLALLALEGDQMLDGLPSGPIMAKVPRIIKVTAGETYVATENPLGEMGYYVVSKGGLGPFRVKIRTASFNNISIVPWIMKGVFVPDIITILASLYFILGDIDR